MNNIMRVMRAYDIIKKKRDGLSLSKDELSFFLNAYLKGRIPDYQASALLMAVLLRGMNPEETGYLTEVMLNSGRVLDLSHIRAPKVDKHSTGGVGDKISLILTPLAASAGIIVPMMSGRGLGHTGGTLDKLESIPGFKTLLNIEELKEALSSTGCAIVGVHEDMAPLDRKLYALRDVTATVESIPLITGSIMSKKLSEGIQGLVLDVKVGSGAFMKDIERARELAAGMVETGNYFGVRTVAVITNMDEPLGFAVGNAHEVLEAIDALKGNGPPDVMEVTLYLGAMMLRVAGIEPDMKEGRRKLEKLIEDGSALEKFRDMVRQQGGDADIIENSSLLPLPGLYEDVRSEKEGFVISINAEAVGAAAVTLGAGRETMESAVDHSAGVLLKKKVGDFVRRGDVLCTLCAGSESAVAAAAGIYHEAVAVGTNPPAKRKMIMEVIER